MAIKNNRPDILHRIRCKLYPSYLPNANGSYLARTSNESVLTVEQVCASLKDRAGYSGNYDDLLSAVKQYHEEVVYLVCDGFAVSNGYFTVNPVIRGSFGSAKEDYNRDKNPVDFHFRVSALLRRLANLISVDIEGIADVSGYIDKFIDIEANSENSFIIPGNQFKLSGYKVKIIGGDPGIGLYIVSVDDPTKRVKIERIAENSPSSIIGIIPKTKSKLNRIEICTQYSGHSSRLLKKPRVIVSNFTVESM